MKEELLSFIWKNRMFTTGSLKSRKGKPVSVIHPGYENQDAGPDYTMARLRFDQTLWVGEVELHVKTSDYIAHNHQSDPAYDKLIAHVVWDHDLNYDPSGAMVLIELKSQSDPNVKLKALRLFRSRRMLACEGFAEDLPLVYKRQILDSAMVARLVEKSEPLFKLRSEQTIWHYLLIQLFSASGAPINKEPMKWLAELINPKHISALVGKPLDMEALLFGQAGFLNTPVDAYQKELKKRFDFLVQKWKLEVMDSKVFKTGKMRPQNFPTVLIAVWASILSKYGHRFMDLVLLEKMSDAYSFFQEPAGDYWLVHHGFGRKGKQGQRKFGPAILQRIFINAVIPFLFGYGRLGGNEALEIRAMNWMAALPPEDNYITRKFKTLDWKLKSAADSQALIYWFKNRCQAKKCLNCPIANHWLKYDTETT